MKRPYSLLTIRQLKARLSHLSRTTFKITRRLLGKLGIDKRDWSRLNKAEIIRVLNYCSFVLSLRFGLASGATVTLREYRTPNYSYEYIFPIRIPAVNRLGAGFDVLKIPWFSSVHCSH